MTRLKYLTIIFLSFILFNSCEIENNFVEILSLSASDSVAAAGEPIMLYCEAVDGDGDKLKFSWETSDGPFSTDPDSTEWIPPNEKGIFFVTCKVSDAIGSSDAQTIAINVYQPTPVPVSGLEWSLNDSGLLGGSNASNPNNTGVSDYWDGTTENADYGWNITEQIMPNREISQSLQFKVEDSANCGGDNPNTQAGTATANIQVNGDVPILLELDFSGMGEAQSSGYDLIQFKLDGVVIGDGQAPGGGLGCTSDSVLVNPADAQSLDPGPHRLIINFTTNDGQYHVDAYYEIGLKLTIPR
tara:strand:+ start:321 stop:1220 length:900 start_codon:yes stop_codon:yes gene_type:complete